MTEQTPDWVLERYRLGELDGPRKIALEAELETNPALQARLDALDASDADILKRYPPRVVEAQVRAKVSPQRRGFDWRWLAVPALAAALVGVTLSLNTTAPIGAPDGGEVRLKGGDAFLRVFHDEGSDASELHSGDDVAPGDTVQLAYVGGQQSFGVIISIDGRGSLSQHWPVSGHDAAALDDAPSVLLPTALRLDDAPDFERFFFVTSTEPFALDEVRAAAEALADGPSPTTADLSLPTPLEQASFLLIKEVQP